MTEEEQRRFEVILEDIQGKLTLVLEGHDAIRQEFNTQLDDVREQQKLFMALLKGSHGELKEDIQSVRTELKEDIQSVRTELKEDIRGVCTELKEDIRAVDKRSGQRDAELKREIRSMREELLARIEAVGGKVDGHGARIAELERKVA